MRTIKHNEEVLYVQDAVVSAAREDIESLKQQASANARKRSRICTHRDVDNTLHEMLIVLQKETYVQPHKHIDKTESFHIIEGATDVILFNDHGAITSVIPMKEYTSGSPFYYRLADPVYHTLLVRSDMVVFHETTNGPFNRSDTLFAPWAPNETDHTAVVAWIDDLTKRVEDFKSV